MAHLVPCLHQHQARGGGRGRRKQPAVGERPFPEVRDGEMEAIGGAAARGSGRNAFAVRRVVFPIAEMADPHRRRHVRKRLWSELDTVRDLLGRAELYSSAAASGAAAAPVVVEEEEEEGDGGGGCRAAKKSSRKAASPFAERTTTTTRRERLAGRLASMAAALPDHAVAFLQDGAADDDEKVEMGVQPSSIVKRDGRLLQLKMLLDEFAPERTPENHGGRPRGAPPPLAASFGGGGGTSCCGVSQQEKLQEEEEAGGEDKDRMLLPPPVQEQEEEGVNICGGVARIAIGDIAEEYGELVNDDVGVQQLLSPLQRKYVDLADQADEYVDICGDASPVVFPPPNKTGDGDGSSSKSLLSSSSDADATTSSTDSDLSSSSSPEALPIPKENSDCRAGEPAAVPPAPEAHLDLDPTPIQGKHNTPLPAAEPEENQNNQCAAETVFAITKTPPAATVLLLPKECGTRRAQPPPPSQQLAPEAVQIAHPEELKQKCLVAAPAATTVHHITGGAPPPVVLPNESSCQPAPPVVAQPQIAEPQTQPQPKPQQQQQQVQAQQTTSNLTAMARQERKRRAMAKAWQELRELERAAIPDERIDPRDMELLGIAPFEHVVSTVRDARTAPQIQVKDGAPLRIYPGCPSILQQLGVFLKPDGGAGEEEEEERPPPVVAVVSDGEEDMEVEDGQIL